MHQGILNERAAKSLATTGTNLGQPCSSNLLIEEDEYDDDDYYVDEL